MDRDDLKTFLVILAIPSVCMIGALGLGRLLRRTGPIERSVPLAVTLGDRVFESGELKISYEPVFSLPATRGSSGRPYRATWSRPEYAAPILDEWAKQARTSVRVATAAHIDIDDRMVGMGQLGISPPLRLVVIDGLEGIPAASGDRYKVVYKVRFEGVKEAVEIPVTSWRTIMLVLSPAGRPELAVWIAENPAEADRLLHPFAESKRLYEQGDYTVTSYRYLDPQSSVDRAFGDFYLLSSPSARPRVGIGVIYPGFRQSHAAALVERILSTLSTRLTVVASNSRSSAVDEKALEPLVVEKKVVILKSTPNYQEALEFSKEAAAKLGTKLDLGNLSENKTIGLTLPENECVDNGWDFPCYVARGRSDDGAFISVEYSSAFRGFKEGLYIVVAAIGEPNSRAVTDTLSNAKKYYPDAYAKTTAVYLGCTH